MIKFPMFQRTLYSRHAEHIVAQLVKVKRTFSRRLINSIERQDALNTSKIRSIIDFYKGQRLLLSDGSDPSLDHDWSIRWFVCVTCLDARKNGGLCGYG